VKCLLSFIKDMCHAVNKMLNLCIPWMIRDSPPTIYTLQYVQQAHRMSRLRVAPYIHVCIWVNWTRMYVSQLNMHVYESTEHACIWVNWTCMYMSQLNTHVYESTEHACIWVNWTRMYMVRENTRVNIVLVLTLSIISPIIPPRDTMPLWSPRHWSRISHVSKYNTICVYI